MQNISPDKLFNQLLSTLKLLRQKFNRNNPVRSLSIAQIETLRIICEKGGLFMKDLADFLAITPPSATAMVDHLAGEGLITRKQDKDDRRTILLILTKKGKAVLEKAERTKNKIFKQLVKNLNADEQMTLYRILTKIESDKHFS